MKLTTKEKEVLTLFAKGLTSKDIAHELGNSVHTINGIKDRMIKKNNCKNIVELACSHCMSDLKPSINYKDYTDRYTQEEIMEALGKAFEVTECLDDDISLMDDQHMIIGLCGKKAEVVEFMIEFHKRLPG